MTTPGGTASGIADMPAPDFRAETHRQSLAVAASPQASEDQAFIDAVSDPDTEQGTRRRG